jgi:hypothetical protein
MKDKKTLYKVSIDHKVIYEDATRKKVIKLFSKKSKMGKRMVIRTIEKEIKPSKGRLVQINRFKEAVDKAKTKVEEAKKNGTYEKGMYKNFMKQELKIDKKVVIKNEVKKEENENKKIEEAPKIIIPNIKQILQFDDSLIKKENKKSEPEIVEAEILTDIKEVDSESDDEKINDGNEE